MSWLYRDIYKKVQADKDMKANAYLRYLKDNNLIGRRFMQDDHLRCIKLLKHNISPFVLQGWASSVFDSYLQNKDRVLWEKCWKKHISTQKLITNWIMIPRRGPLGLDSSRNDKDLAWAFSKRNGLGMENVVFNYDETGYVIHHQQHIFTRTYMTYDAIPIHMFIKFYTAVKRDYIWEKYCTPTYRIRYGIILLS